MFSLTLASCFLAPGEGAGTLDFWKRNSSNKPFTANSYMVQNRHAEGKLRSGTFKAKEC